MLPKRIWRARNISTTGLRDYAGASPNWRLRGERLPNDPRLFELTGYILRRRGQQRKVCRTCSARWELDPRNFFTLQQIALSYLLLGRYAEAIACMDRRVSDRADSVETRTSLENFTSLESGHPAAPPDSR